MSWKIKVSEAAKKSLSKMDKGQRSRVFSKLREIEGLQDPRSSGKALTGALSRFWRYRAGDWRIICEIEDDVLVVLVIDIGHRSKVYRHR